MGRSMPPPARLSETGFSDREAVVEECRRLGLMPTLWVCPRCLGQTRIWAVEGQPPPRIDCFQHPGVFLEPLSGL